MHPSVEHFIPLFKYDHLPESLQELSKPFAEVAQLFFQMEANPEVSAGLRKLLEAKDCAVRAGVIGSALERR